MAYDYNGDIVSTTNSYIKVALKADLISQSISNNTSTVEFSTMIWRTNSGYTTYGNGTIKYNIDGNSSSKTLDPDDKITDTKKVFGTFRKTFKHNSEGRYHLDAGVTVKHDKFSTNSTSNFNVYLPSIPRASTISSFTFSEYSYTTNQTNYGRLNLSLSRKSSSFTHTVKIYLNNLLIETISDVGTSLTYNLPLSKLPNASSAIAKVVVQTKSGSTDIGDAVSATVSTVINSTYAPTIAWVAGQQRVLISNPSTLDANTIYQNQTTASISPSSYITSTRGASSFRVELYLNDILLTSPSFTFSKIGTSQTIRLKIIDSRGYSSSITTTTIDGTNVINVLEYKSLLPKITFIERGSYDSANTIWSSSSEGVGFSLLYEVTGSLLEKATNFQVYYKESTLTDYTLISSSSYLKVNSSNDPIAGYVRIKYNTILFDNTKDFNFLIKITDAFGKVITSKVVLLAKSSVIWNISKTGTGFSFGELAKENTFSVKNSSILLKGDINLQGNTVLTGTLNTGNKIRSAATFQAGWVNMPSAGSGERTTVDVVFSTPFLELPAVTLTPNSVSPHHRFLGVSNLTTTGFRINFVNTASTATRVGAFWIAMAKTQADIN